METIVGSEVTKVGTTQRFPLGYLAQMPANGPDQTVDYGAKTYRYIYNDSGATILAGRIVIRKSVTATFNGLMATAGTVFPKIRVLGVAETAIPTGSYGWVVCKGIITGKAGDGAAVAENVACGAGGGTTDGTFLTSANSGTGAMGAFGLCLKATEIAATETGNIYIDCE